MRIPSPENKPTIKKVRNYFPLYSQRQKDAQGQPEVFVYDKFPASFRNQVFTIINQAIRTYSRYDINFNGPIQEICENFSQEKGLKGLFEREQSWQCNTTKALQDYIDYCNDIDFLDLVDFTFRYYISSPNFQRIFQNNPENNSFLDAIDELNIRFKQHSLGYEFVDRTIIVKTNTFAHEQVIKPALYLLHDKEFAGAEDEYLLAYENFRKGTNKDAISNAAKAFESFLKAICLGLGYKFDREHDTARKLIAHLKENEFYPSYLHSEIETIQNALEKGAPTVRNKVAGHGQGETVLETPDEYVEFVLNLVAANMIFLHKLYRQKKKKTFHFFG